MRSPDLQPAGTYGFRLEGVDGARDLLSAADPSWPRLSLEVTSDAIPAPERELADDERAEIRLRAGGWFEMDRAAGAVVFHLGHRPDAGALVHPYLAPAAAIAARWHGREGFHAGAIVAQDGDGRAWGIVGEKEAGKSSALATLALGGHTVLTDDVLILDDGDVLAGPRCIDLRAEPARRLGAGEPLGVVGARERWRLALAPAPARSPLAGWVILEWGERFDAQQVSGSERLLTLVPHRALRLAPADPVELLHLSSLPCWRIRRSRDLRLLEDDSRRLLETLET